MKKRVIMLFAFMVFIYSIYSALALGISPGKQSVDFKPGLELEYSFKVYSSPEQKIELYCRGELCNLTEFDKKELTGSGSFNVKIKLPAQIEKPGKHTILIGAREKIEEGMGVGTSVAIQSPIIIMVPYPGKYAEINFRLHNVNVGEAVKFEIEVASMGKEPILASANIEIYSNEEKIETINLGAKLIENQKSNTFIKLFDTTSYKPGDYKAIAIVDYQDGIAKADSIFRIGKLFVNITNYTKEVIKQGIRPFSIDIESLWNDFIENIYGEVYILSDNKTISEFMTPPTSLAAWEKKTLLGYFDTDKLEIKEYNTRIKINYKGNYSIQEDKLKITKKSDYLVYYAGGVILLVLILIAIYIRKKISEYGKKKKKRQ